MRLNLLVSSELAGASKQIICEAWAGQVHCHVATALQLFGVSLEDN